MDSRDLCKYYPIIPILIILIYIIILYTSITIFKALFKQESMLIIYMIPVTAILLTIASISIRDTVSMLGGPKEYFCSGLRLLIGVFGGKYNECRPSHIVTWGPFKYTRHPVYTSTILITIAFTLIAPGVAFSIPIIYLWVYVASRIEERKLIRDPIYIRYMKRTPRFSICGVIKYGLARLGGRSFS